MTIPIIVLALPPVSPKELTSCIAAWLDWAAFPPEKNAPIQSIVERQIQLAAVKFIDEIIVYNTEQDLMDLLLTLPIKVRVLGDEYKAKDFTGKDIAKQRGIKIIYNGRDHSFSSSSLRKRVVWGESDFVNKAK